MNSRRTRFAGIVALVLVVVFVYASWRRGWVIAEVDYFRVREVPLAVDWLTIPGTTDFCYIIEVGGFPFESTFRVGWDSYEAKSVRIKAPTRTAPELEIDFDGLYKVTCSLGGDIQSAEWHTQSAFSPEPTKGK